METVAQTIRDIRGKRVILDSDLAQLYGVTTKQFNQAVKRNLERFPDDFMFQLTAAESSILRSQIVTSSSGYGGRRYLPYAFTEHGAVMAATVLNSPTAVQVSVFVVRAFVQMRELLLTHTELAYKLERIERRLQERFVYQEERIDGQEDRLDDHENQLEQLINTLNKVIAALDTRENTPRRPIGFRAGDEIKQ